MINFNCGSKWYIRPMGDIKVATISEVSVPAMVMLNKGEVIKYLAMWLKKVDRDLFANESECRQVLDELLASSFASVGHYVLDKRTVKPQQEGDEREYIIRISSWDGQIMLTDNLEGRKPMGVVMAQQRRMGSYGGQQQQMGDEALMSRLGQSSFRPSSMGPVPIQGERVWHQTPQPQQTKTAENE